MDLNAADVITVVRYILDYLGFDVESWEFDWPTWRSDIRHQSLVRIVGTYGFKRKARRINFQPNLIGQCPRPPFRSNSMDSVFTITSESFAGEGIGHWMEEELDDGKVHIRVGNLDDMLVEGHEDDPGNGLSVLNFPPQKTSTPVDEGHRRRSMSQTDMTKIVALEDELARLREQIALIVVNQEQGSVMLRTHSESVMSVTADLKDMEKQTDVIRDLPPLPPPLPPPPMNLLPSSSPQKNLSEVNKGTPQNGVSTATDPRPVHMSNILKEITNVKLRSVQRSPGGTPLRRKPVANEPVDPASIIASALKKKFASRRQFLESPTTDKENSSLENSPRTPTGQYCGKKFARRKSDLCTDSTVMVQPLSPLTEVNAK